MKPIRLVTFDATGTLLQFRYPVYQIYYNAAKLFDFNPDSDVLKTNFKRSYKMTHNSHPNFGKQTGIGYNQWWRNVVLGTFENLIKNEEDLKKARKLSDHLIAKFETEETWCLSEGVRNLLNNLRDNKKINLGVISNYDPRLHLILKNLDIYKYFDFVLTSYELGFEKPDKRVFQKAAEISNTHPTAELHVGDNLKLDYDGAKRAGWQACLFSHDHSLRDQQHIFRDMKSLERYLLSVIDK